MRQRSFSFALFWLTALALVATPASASLVEMFYAKIDVSGTGHGNVTQILGFGNLSPTASGCVKWTTGGNAYGGACSGEVFGNQQLTSPSWASTTVVVGAVGIASPFDLAIVYNPSQKASIQVDRLALTLYDPAHPSVNITADLAAPVPIAIGGAGSGGSGFVFGLDWDSAVAVQQWLVANSLDFSTVRLGLGAAISQHEAHSYFFVADIDGLVVVPEPATLGLMGSALLGLAYLLRRRRKQG